MNNNLKKKILLYWLKKQFIEYIEEKQNGGSFKWKTFIHNGVMFPPEYIPHKIPLKYNNEYITLEPLAEEFATLFAKYIDTEYINNKNFKKNFWNDWKKILGKNHKIQSLDECDFTQYKEYLTKIKDDKKKLEPINEDIYKTAIVDGKIQPVGNFRVEPPGIFLGRGDNPKLGKIKNRIYPEDITLNIGKDSPIPLTLENHKWGKIIHDNNVIWIASWKDTINNKTKYVWLGEQSDFKTNSDINKFELARKLKKKIPLIEKENEINLDNTSIKIRQIATSLYFIDKLALRVGNEKSSDETDTVGVTSLRIEHVKLEENNIVMLDFLGKDSVRYYNKIQVDPKVYKNLQEFMTGKSKQDQLFDSINTSDINKYLQTFMKDLTAKVFRTYNSSNLFQKEINKINRKYSNTQTPVSILMDEYSKANAKIAKQLNHQKNITKSYKDNIIKIKESINILKKKYTDNSDNKNKAEEIKKKLLSLKSKLELKKELKNISLGTSKANYIDPRITISFMKLHNIPIEKVFTKALQNKFKWAFDVDETYNF